jgi:hypothetical protein
VDTNTLTATNTSTTPVTYLSIEDAYGEWQADNGADRR